MRSVIFAMVVCAGGLLATPAQAKCFGFRGEDIKVCIDGDSSSIRKKASEVCEDIVGHSCSVSGTSGECRKSSSTTCYDENGDEQKYIDSDIRANFESFYVL